MTRSSGGWRARKVTGLAIVRAVEFAAAYASRSSAISAHHAEGPHQSVDETVPVIRIAIPRGKMPGAVVLWLGARGVAPVGRPAMQISLRTGRVGGQRWKGEADAHLASIKFSSVP